MDYTGQEQTRYTNQGIVVMRNQTIITAVLLTLVTTSSVFASEIYKWIDEEGNVHYGDTPTETSERVAISSKPTNPSVVQSTTKSVADYQAQRTENLAAAAAEAASAAELKAEADQRAQQCTQYRQTMQKFVVSRRLYREDENGEREYLDESETLAARDRVEKQVEEFCT